MVHGRFHALHPKGDEPMNRVSSWLARHSVVIGCCLLGAALRILWFREAEAKAFFYAHVQDAAVHHELAQRVLAGGLPFETAFDVPPLYGLFLGGIYATVGVDPGPVYLIQVALSLGTIALAVRLGGSLFGRPGALIAGLTAALHPASIVFDVRLVGVSLATVLFLATATLAHRAWNTGRAFDWGLPGFILGMAGMVQGHLLIAVVPLAIAAVWRGRIRCALPFVLGVGLAVSPSVWHNHQASGEVTVGALGGGITAYQGNNSHVQTGPVHPFRLPAAPNDAVSKAALIARIETQTDLTPAQADRYWLIRAMKHASESPKRAVGLAIRKATQVFGSPEYPAGVDPEAVVKASPVLRWIPPLMGPVGVLSILGLIGVRRARDAAVFAVVFGALIGMVSVVVVAPYRTTLVPLLGVYAGGGVMVLMRALRSRGRRVFAGWVAGAAAVFGGLTAAPTAPLLPWNAWVGEPEPASACAIEVSLPTNASVDSLFHMGVFALNHGRLKDAEEAMWSVLKQDASHTAAGVNLSGLLLRRGATTEAEQVAQMMVNVDACDDKAWSNLATAQLREREFTAARASAARATRIDPYNPGYWSLLGEAELALGQSQKAQLLFERTVRWAPDLWQARARLGRIYFSMGRYQEASAHLQVAVKAQPGREELVGLLGLSEVALGNPDGARSLLRAAVKSGQRGPTLTALARAIASANAP